MLKATWYCVKKKKLFEGIFFPFNLRFFGGNLGIKKNIFKIKELFPLKRCMCVCIYLHVKKIAKNYLKKDIGFLKVRI